MENIKELLKMDNVRFIHGSITDLEHLQRSFNGIDYVFHQAALASVPRSIQNLIGSNEVNITGTLNVLTVARDCGIKKVIYASSSSVYGDTPTLPKMEDMSVNPYRLMRLQKPRVSNFAKFHRGSNSR